jgi:SHS2 domain-containing protein
VSYEWAEHVGELELRVEASEEAAVFEDALAALHELLADDDGVRGELEWRDVHAHGEDRAVLLAAWIEELAFLAETEAFVPERIGELELGAEHVRARVGGRLGSPPHLVKAVTYHRLAFEPADGGWRATAVLDV